MDNFITKVSDDVFAFIKSPTWLILRNRCIVYQTALKEQLSNSIRNQEWNTVARIQGMIDSVENIIQITERLPKEILEGEFDVDVALNVIENKLKQN